MKTLAVRTLFFAGLSACCLLAPRPALAHHWDHDGDRHEGRWEHHDRDRDNPRREYADERYRWNHHEHRYWSRERHCWVDDPRYAWDAAQYHWVPDNRGNFILIRLSL